MSKNNIVIITTRWMNVKEDEEGFKQPIHCYTGSPFKEIELSKADRILAYLESHPSDHLRSDITNDKYYSLVEGNYYIYILPCLKKFCSDPEEWIRTLVNQFSMPGDVVRMMIHASSDLCSEPRTFSSYADIDDRDLKIRAYSHVIDSASNILLCDTYLHGITALNIFTYISNLFNDLSSIVDIFEESWEDFLAGEKSLEEMCSNYKQLLMAAPKDSDIRGYFLPSLEDFRSQVETIDDNPEYCDVVEQLLSKF